MKLTTYGAVALIAISGALAADDGPQPRVVSPGKTAADPPSDAIVLFDGRDLSHWTRRDGTSARCTVEGGSMVCKTGAGDIYSKEKFRDVQLHLEFAVPNMPDQHGQLRGNSGVLIHGVYEVQILDSYQNPTYANGVCGAIYGQHPPLVNASRPPAEWQTYDIVFHGRSAMPRTGSSSRSRCRYGRTGCLSRITQQSRTGAVAKIRSPSLAPWFSRITSRRIRP